MRNISLCMLLFMLYTIVPGISQNLDKTITMICDKITIKEAITQIEKQTGYSIAYEQSELNLAQVISLSLINKEINIVMKQLLKNTQYSFKIIGYHIIIFDDHEKENLIKGPKYNKQIPERILPENSGHYLLSGLVVDSITQEALAYSTITLLDKQGNIQIVGITDNNGIFKIKTPQKPSQLIISFVGYSTYSKELNLEKSIGKIQLSPCALELSGTTITVNTIEHKIDRDVYMITDKMRKQAANAQEILDQIQGVRFDKLSNTIRVGNETAVLLLVDGVQKSAIYIKNLSPNRISNIELITEPGGKYVSDEYAAIINFILKDDYTGYDIIVHNSSVFSLDNKHDGNNIINEKPEIGITYTKKKVNVFANYSFVHVLLNTPLWKRLIYTDQIEMYPIKEDVEKANNRYKYNTNYVEGGINYQITPKQVISFQGDYTYQNTEEINRLKYNVLYLNNNSWSQLSTFREDGTKDKDYAATIFYKGEYSKLFNIYSDFTYNYYSNKVTNEFKHGHDNYSIDDYYESKNYTRFNLEGERTVSPKFKLNLGYTNVWRKYKSANDNNFLYLYYNEWRNLLFSHLQYNVNNKLTIKGGINVEYIKTYSETKNNDWSILPYFQLNYKANKNVNINVSYQTNSDYPTLFQLSPLTTILDSITRQSGNPALKSAVRHTFSAKLTLWNMLTIKSSTTHTPKGISEVYTDGVWSNTVFSSFMNIHINQNIVQLIYVQPLSKHINFSNTLTYYSKKASYQETKNSYRGWLLDSEIKYYNPKINFETQIGYYRNIDKSTMLQGYQMINMDSWQITLNKHFLQKQISFMITYFPPLSLGVRKGLIKEIDTPFYSEKVTQSLNPYKNMLLLRFNMRFNSGNTKSHTKQNVTEKEKRANRSVNLK